jgi:hypothetical protein
MVWMWEKSLGDVGNGTAQFIALAIQTELSRFLYIYIYIYIYIYCHVPGRITWTITTWIRICTGFIRSEWLQPRQIRVTGNTLALAVPWILLLNSLSQLTTSTHCNWLTGTNLSLAIRCGNWTDLTPVVSYFLYIKSGWPNRNTGFLIVEVSHSWLSCNNMVLVESPAYPYKFLTCRCLATIFDQTRHNIG